MSTTSDTSIKSGKQSIKSSSNGPISYADVIGTNNTSNNHTASNVVTTKLHASLLPRALSYGSQQSSAPNNAPKDPSESQTQSAAAKQRTFNALTAVNSKIDNNDISNSSNTNHKNDTDKVSLNTNESNKQNGTDLNDNTNKSVTPTPTTDTNNQSAANKNNVAGNTNGTHESTSAQATSSSGNPIQSQQPVTTSESSPRARNSAGNRQSGSKNRNNRKSYDHSGNISPRQYNQQQMFDNSMQRQMSNPNLQPAYYRQPSTGRIPQSQYGINMNVNMNIPQQYMQYNTTGQPHNTPFYIPAQAADMIQLQQSMQQLGRQISNSQTTNINTSQTSSPRSSASRSLASSVPTATGSPITPSLPARQVSSSNSPLLSGPTGQPVINPAPAVQLHSSQSIPLPTAGYYYDPRYQAFVPTPQMQSLQYNVPPQYYQHALHQQQQQLRYQQQPIYNNPPPQQYIIPQQYSQQQPMVVALAKFPPQITAFPPTTVTTMPSFTTLVIPNPGQLPSQPPDKQTQMYFSIDVECVAIGPGHNDRAVGSIAVVDMHENVVLNIIVKPDVPVVSCLTQLTGLQPYQINSGVALAQALQLVKSVITPNSLIVGQNILKDINWLGLTESVDYHSLCDLAGCYRVKNQQYHNWSTFSLSHIAKSLLGLVQSEPHHAADDAYLSIKLYALHKRLSEKSNDELKKKADELLLSTTADASFSKRFPEIDGVCLGNKKTCKCGQAFLF